MVKNDRLQGISNDQLCDIIEMWIRGRNAERNRKILKSRLINGTTFEKLAEEHEMSVRQIKNVVYNGECAILENAQ